MTTHIEGSSRIFGPEGRKTTLDFNEKIQHNNERISQSFRSVRDFENMTSMPRTFGLEGRSSIFSTNGHQHSRLIQEPEYRACSESSTSTSFGLGPINSKYTSGFLPKNSMIHESEYTGCSESKLDPRSSFGLARRTSKFTSGFLPHNNGRFNREFRSLERRTSVVPQTFGLHSTLGGSSLMEDNRFNQNTTNFRSNTENMSIVSRTLEPVNKSTALSADWRVQERLNENDDDGFKKPYLSRCVRGRSSTLATRLFPYQSVDKYSKNLSNVNGLNVTHISRRGMDSFSESKLPVTRYNYMDNHSVTGSVVSVASVKAQVMNLLENLQHSILNLVPNLPADVTLEFDKAKEGLENIKEMSFAPSIRDNDGASVISFSTQQICTQIPDQTSNKIVSGSSVLLKSGQDLIKELSRSERNERVETNEVQPSFVTTTQVLGRVDEREENELDLKTPRLFTKKISKSQMLKIKTPKVTRGLKTLVMNKIINLKQWYPIAVGEDLAFCGVNEEGAVVKTEPVKKRVNNRKIELINGLLCNLIGSPSNSVVSALPKKILSRLKNGLTDRWRVLQKELLDCQTSETESKKRHSKTPKKKESPKKKTPPKVVEKKSSSPKTVVKKVSPQKKKDGVLGHTRSGRVVKRPGNFWILSAESAVKDSPTTQVLNKKVGKTSSKNTQKAIEDTPVAESKRDVERTPTKKLISSMASTPTKKFKGSVEKSPAKKSKASVVKSPAKKSKSSIEKSSPKKSKASVEKSPSKKSKASLEKSPAKKIKTSVEKSPTKKSMANVEKTPTKKSKTSVENTPTKKSKRDVSETPTEKGYKEETSTKVVKTLTKKPKGSAQKTPGKKVKSSVQKTPTRKVKGSVERTPAQKLMSSEKKTSSKSRKGVRCTPVKKVRRGIATLAKRLSKSPSKTPVKTAKKGRPKSSQKSLKKKSPVKTTSPKKVLKEEVAIVHSSTEDAESKNKTIKSRAGRKRKATVDVSSTEIKRNKSESQIEAEVESTVNDLDTPAVTTKKSKLTLIRGRPPISKKKTTSGKAMKLTETKLGRVTETSSFIRETREGNDFDEDFEFQLDEINIPDVANVSGNPQLSKSQLRTVSMETPPLKYFNNNLRILRSVTPVRSPDWCISQRTESEVKQFQKRRAEAHRKKIKVEVKKTVVQEKTKSFGQNKDLNRVLDWVAEKNIRSPQWHSRVLQYIIPSRKLMEQEDEEEDEEFET